MGDAVSGAGGGERRGKKGVSFTYTLHQIQSIHQIQSFHVGEGGNEYPPLEARSRRWAVLAAAPAAYAVRQRAETAQ